MKPFKPQRPSDLEGRNSPSISNDPISLGFETSPNTMSNGGFSSSPNSSKIRPSKDDYSMANRCLIKVSYSLTSNTSMDTSLK